MQIIGEGMGDTYLKLKFGDQQRAFQAIESSSVLKKLKVLKSPLIDLEVRGVPALQYFGSIVWGEVLDEFLQREFIILSTLIIASPALKHKIIRFPSEPFLTWAQQLV